MTDKQVWYPSRSRTAAESMVEQERGRGSFKPPKAPQPVVQPRVPEANGSRVGEKKRATSHEQSQKVESCYSTVERTSDLSILNYSELSNTEGQSSVHEFSGWADREVLTTSLNRRAPANALRNTVHSRLETRGSQRHREPGYEFQHFLDSHLHIELYRAHYSFTTLSVAPPENTGSELVDQGKQTLLKLQVKSLYRTGDPYLKELATRLGVSDSIRDPQLLTPQKHTPPSIVKKQKARSDLAIDLLPKPRSDEQEDDQCNAWTVEPPAKVTSPSKHTPLELPRIPEVVSIPHKDKTSSTISISKYLRVSSQGEDGSDHTLPHVPTSHTLLSSASSEETLEVTECTDIERQTDKPLFQPEKPLLHTLDKAQKEKLISHTAHSLGLSSREWAAPTTNKQMNRYLNYNTRPSTRQATRAAAKVHDNRPSTRQDVQSGRHTKSPIRSSTRQERPGTQQESASKQTRPPTRQQDARPSTHHERAKQDTSTSEHKRVSRPQSTVQHREKLKRLRSIYTSQHSDTRPPTRAHTRPPTRAHTRLKIRDNTAKLDPLDGSSYWNEVPGQRSDKLVKQTPEKFSPMRFALELSSHPSEQVTTGVHRTHTKRTKGRVNEELTPGASPVEIARHLSRLKRKFDGMLNIHKHEISSAN